MIKKKKCEWGWEVGKKGDTVREQMGLYRMLSPFTNGLDGAPHRVFTNSTNTYLVPVK